MKYRSGKLPVVTEYTLLAPVKKPVRAAVVADLHNGAWERMFEKLCAAQPELVLIAGDLIEDTAEDGQQGLAFLRACAARYPTFYGLGNHERNLTEDDFRIIRDTGATLLVRQWAHWGELVIGSVRAVPGDNPENHAFVKRFCMEPGCRVLLCHRPEWYEAARYREYPIPVFLAGHAHGGQMRPFGIGLYAPGQGIFPKYTAGIHEGRLVISRGLGSRVPIPRLWNPPEVVMLTLSPQSGNTQA